MKQPQVSDDLPSVREPNTAASENRFQNIAVGVCVFVSGACVMVYEFLAVRILARYFGSAFEVWSSEIAVCLAGLALGYSLGGFLADTYRSLRLMGAGMVLAGLSGWCIEPLATSVGEWLLEVEVGLAWHPLVSALVCSFIPFLALGTVLPQAVRLRARRLEKVGVSTGCIAALSTLGNIVGVLVTSMILLPTWGVRKNLRATSALLVLVGAVIAIRFRQGRASRAAALAFAILWCAPIEARILLDEYSAYHHILVRDSETTRSLFFDNAEQSRMSLEDPAKGAFEYTDLFHVPPLFDPRMDSVLFIGLGGGSGPKSFLRNYPDMRVEVSEIDSKVVQVARRYFSVPADPRLEIVTLDGRAYLQRARNRYGAILVDAYASGRRGPYLPYHLVTQEFFRIASSRLENGGCIVFNVMGTYGGLNDFVVRTLQVTLQSIFPVVYAFQVASSVNTVFVAVKIDLRYPEQAGVVAGNLRFRHPLTGRDLRRLVIGRRNQGVPLPKGLERLVTQFSAVRTAPQTVKILTDDFSPIDLSAQFR